jgi:hypothetical protein
VTGLERPDVPLANAISLGIQGAHHLRSVSPVAGSMRYSGLRAAETMRRAVRIMAFVPGIADQDELATEVTLSNSFNVASAYTSDTTTMSSTTPINYSMTKTASVTSMTKTFNVTGSGTALIVGFGGFGITNGTESFTTPNDPSITNDISTATFMTGAANNFGPNGSTRVSATWTTTGDGYIGAVGFR